MPWIILSVVVFVWGLPQVKALLDGISIVRVPVPGLHNLVLRVPPVVAAPAPEAAVFALNWLSATGIGHSSRRRHRRPDDGIFACASCW